MDTTTALTDALHEITAGQMEAAEILSRHRWFHFQTSRGPVNRSGAAWEELPASVRATYLDVALEEIYALAAAGLHIAPAPSVGGREEGNER